jgi:hypothetical protein
MERAPAPIGYEAGWATESFSMILRRGNSWPYRGPKPYLSVVQHVAGLCTDCVTAALDMWKETLLICFSRFYFIIRLEGVMQITKRNWTTEVFLRAGWSIHTSPSRILSNRYWTSFRMIKRSKHEAGHWPPSTAEVKNVWTFSWLEQRTASHVFIFVFCFISACFTTRCALLLLLCTELVLNSVLPRYKKNHWGIEGQKEIERLERPLLLRDYRENESLNKKFKIEEVGRSTRTL